MRRVRIVCVGMSPLMMDAMSDAVLNSLDRGVKLQIVKDRPLEAKAQEKIYLDKEGRIGLPADMLLSALVGAGRNVKVGKSQISTATSTKLFDYFQMESPFLLLTNGRDGESAEWVPDRRRGVSNQSKSPTAVAIVRPIFDEWGFEAIITYDDGKNGRDTIQKLFTEAGSTQGIGSFRPNRKGRYGMFRVIEWHEVTLPDVERKILVTLDGNEDKSELVAAPEKKKAKSTPAV